MKSRGRNRHFDADIVILAGKLAPRAIPPASCKTRLRSTRAISTAAFADPAVRPVRTVPSQHVSASQHRLSERDVVTSIVVAMIVILVVASLHSGSGPPRNRRARRKQRAPKIADRMARAAQHLNGDGGTSFTP